MQSYKSPLKWRNKKTCSVVSSLFPSARGSEKPAPGGPARGLEKMISKAPCKAQLFCDLTSWNSASNSQYTAEQ